jgi:hypothetical protein
MSNYNGSLPGATKGIHFPYAGCIQGKYLILKTSRKLATASSGAKYLLFVAEIHIPPKFAGHLTGDHLVAPTVLT